MGTTPIIGTISASQGSAILGLNPYQSRFDYWCKIMEEIDPGFCEKNNYPVPEIVDNAAIRRGNAFEDGIIEVCEKISGYPIHSREKLFTKSFQWGDITCHVDGIYDNFDGGTIHEAKTVSGQYFRTHHWKQTSEEDPTGRLPKYYEVQLQHQQICSEIDNSILSALVIPFDDTIELPTDPATIILWSNVLNDMGFMYQWDRKAKPEAREAMLGMYSDFMTHNIMKQIPPEPMTDDDYKWLHWNFGEIEADKKIINAIAERKDLKKEIKEAENRIKDLTGVVKRFMADNHADAFKPDTESNGMVILKDGKKLASYTKNKNGAWSFR